jgi:hypothetical protein
MPSKLSLTMQKLLMILGDLMDSSSSSSTGLLALPPAAARCLLCLPSSIPRAALICDCLPRGVFTGATRRTTPCAAVSNFPAKNAPLFSTFPMFVPSLSW